jgi:small subunit ribosomal protein S1
MTNTIIGNPELDYLFEESEIKTKEREEMSKLYESTIAELPSNGQIISASYEGVTSAQIIFSVPGFKDDIRVENKPSESRYLTNVEIGDMIDVLIINVNNNNFYIKGSIAELYETRAHQNLKSLEEGTSVTVKVKTLNPAGYDVELLHGGVTLPGFMPNTLAGINKLYDQNSILGETFEVMIESYSEQEGTYIVSRRKYLQTLIPETLKDLNYEDSYTGHVTGTTQFGVFVEFNECLTGMIHKANINPEWQNRISEIKPGFEIDFYIKEIIKDKGRAPKIILTQILRETLWDNIKNGQILDGTIRDVKPFGTLVNLDEETVGLIHTSEMEKLKRKFEPGQELKVKVLSAERGSRKIFLTIA